MSDERLERLQQMAGLVFDTRSAALLRANAARDALLRQLADLEVGPAEAGLVWSAAQQARFGYEQWADQRRAEINLRLAAQRVVCLQVADETRLAFGRKLALERISERMARKARRGAE